MPSSVQTRITEGMIDLGVGHPSLDLLPLAEMEQASRLRFGQQDPSFLQYGAEAGDEGLRRQLGAFLSARSGGSVEPEELFVSGGVSQALDLICTAFTRPGDAVVVEEPTYHLALSIFRSHGLKVVSVPLTPDGLDMERLEGLVAGHRPRLLYTIPTFQNPSGRTLDAGQRRGLVDLAERGDFLVLADEVYQYLSFGDAPLPSFGALVDSRRVLSLGSFSKILAPGLRLGWVHAHPGLLGTLEGSGMLVSGGGISPFTAAMVRGVLDLGLLEPHLDRLRQTYAGRAARLADALRQFGRGALSFEEPAGGYFIWASLPAGLSSASLLGVAREGGVEFKPGGLFSLTDAQEGRLRLCFSYYDQETLREGARRLGAALHGVLGDRETGAS